jgi:hypothetical protein
VNAITIKAKVDDDGVLRLNVALGVEAANQVVRLTIDLISKPRFTKEEWSEIVDENAGFWQGEFERPPQGEFEIRDSL